MPTATTEKLIRLKADTFRAHLRLGLPFRGPIHVPENLNLCDTAIEPMCDALRRRHARPCGCVNLIRLPPRLIVRGKLVLDGCARITALPATVRELFGLSAVGASALASTAPLVECRGPVDLTGCDALKLLSPAFRATGTFAVNGASFHPNHMTLRQKLPDTIMMACQAGGLVRCSIIRSSPAIPSARR